MENFIEYGLIFLSTWLKISLAYHVRLFLCKSENKKAFVPKNHYFCTL